MELKHGVSRDPAAGRPPAARSRRSRVLDAADLALVLVVIILTLTGLVAYFG